MCNQNILEALQEVLLARKGAAASESYVASLYDKGLDQILKKDMNFFSCSSGED